MTTDKPQPDADIDGPVVLCPEHGLKREPGCCADEEGE